MREIIESIPIRNKFIEFDFSEEVKRFSAELDCYIVTIGKGVS